MNRSLPALVAVAAVLLTGADGRSATPTARPVPSAPDPASRLEERLATDYARRTEVAVERYQRLSLETTEFGVVVDGVPREGRGAGGGSDFAARAAWADRWLADDGARATEVRRSYESVGATSTARFGPEATERELDSPFDEAVLRFTVDSEGTRVEIEQGEPEPEAAAGLDPRLPLDALLPEGPVEPGARWAVEGDALERALGLDVHTLLFPEGDQDSVGGDRGAGGRRRGGFRARTAVAPAAVLADLEWTVELTLEAVDEDRVAVVAVEAEGEGVPPTPSTPAGRGGRGAPEPEVDGELRVVLEGDLRFDLAARVPLSLELEGDLTIERETERVMGERELVTTQTQEGELAFEVSVELRQPEAGVEAGEED